MQSKTGLPWLGLSLITFILDLWTKYLVVQRFELYESVNLLPVFNFTYVRNYGAAFSFLADHAGWQKYFFIALAIVISGGLIYLLKKNSAQQKLANAAYALIIGGALANMVDRAYNGFVVDFLHVFYQDWHYPVFNLADVWISCGAGLLTLEFILDSRKKKSD